jgi:DNA-binding CsgD family transcriptional regulator
MKLAERDNELTMLGRLLTACERDTSNIAWISGSVASGKTALIEEFAIRSAARGATVLRAAASHAERTLSLGVLGQLFRPDAMPADVTERPADLVGAGTLTALTQSDPAALTNLTATVFDRLGRMLLGLARLGPVVLIVDDVQYVDVQSLQCLLYLVRRTRKTGVLVVCTECTQHPPLHPVLHAELLRQPNCHRVRLPLLSQDAVAKVMAAHVEPAAAGRLAAECRDVTGGNPLLVHALTEDSRAAGDASPARLTAGTAFRQAVLTCLYRSGPDMVALAKALAVLGDQTTPLLLAELVGQSAESVQLAVTSLRAAGLLGTDGFRLPAARDAVLGSLTYDEYAALHRRAVTALHEHGATATTLAPHLVASEIRAPWVAPRLVEAAEHAMAKGNTDAAITYLRRALKECLDEPRHAATEAALAQAEWRVNPALTVQHLPSLGAALRAGHLRNAPQIKAVMLYQLWHGRVADVTDAFAALAATGRTEERNGVVDTEEIRLWLRSVFPELAEGRLPDHPRPARRASAAIMPVGLKGASVLDATLSGTSEEGTLVAATQILRGSRLGDPTVVPLIVALVALLCADELDQAWSWCRRLLADADRVGVPTWRALLLTVASAISLRQGDLSGAESHAAEALDLLGTEGWGVAIGVPLACLLQARTAAGKQGDAAATLQVPVPPEMFLTPAGVLYMHARGRHYLATGQTHAALEDFQTCGELMLKWDQDTVAMVPWRADAVRACILLGRTGQAEELAAQHLNLAGSRPSRARGIALRAVALTSPLRKRPALLNEAAHLLRRHGDQLELAHTYADLSHAYQALGEYDRATANGRTAHRLADRCGAGQLCGNLPYVATQAPDQDAQPHAGSLAKLSNAERRVATLAAHGYTNRQISSRLHVTVSTVEQHLTRVYRKLQVNRRSELPQNLQLQ